MVPLLFLSESRGPDIIREDSLTRGSGTTDRTDAENERTAMVGSAELACAIHSFLGGGDKQPV